MRGVYGVRLGRGGDMMRVGEVMGVRVGDWGRGGDDRGMG